MNKDIVKKGSFQIENNGNVEYVVYAVEDGGYVAEGQYDGFASDYTYVHGDKKETIEEAIQDLKNKY